MSTPAQPALPPVSRPGGALARRPLHVIFIADCSGSMAGDKIQSLNHAIAESLPAVARVAAENPTAEVLVRAVSFDSGARWHLARPTPVAQATWSPLAASGTTAMGEALSLVAEALAIPPMPERALPPVLILVTDGQPTDDYDEGLKDLLSQGWGMKAVRIPIAIGHDADHGPLEVFRNHAEMPVLQANNAETLVSYIKWASTQAVKAASAPAVPDDAASAAAVTPWAAPVPAPVNANDVW